MVGTFIVAAFAEVTTAAVAASFALTAAAFAVNFAVSFIVTRMFSDNPEKQQDMGVRQQVPPSSVNALPIAYGDVYMGGTFVDAVLSTDQKCMYYVLAISGISPNGQFTFNTSTMYYGDRKIVFSTVDPARVDKLIDDAGNEETKLSGCLYIGLYTSNAAGVITPVNWYAPDVVMAETFAGFTIPADQVWPSSGRQMYGTAFAIVRLEYNQEAGTTQLQPITFHVSHTLNSTGVAKPGDVWLDYITNPIYGGAVDSGFVNSSSATALNTYSDQLITFTDSDGNPATQARYRINGVLDAGQSVLSNIDRIMSACDSWMTYNAALGQWSVVINKAEGVAYEFNDDNIIGDIRVSATDITTSINQVEARFPFKENKDQAAFVNIETPANLLYPNEPVNKYSITYDLVNDSVQTHYLANRLLEQAREDLIVSFSTTYYGIQVNAGDVVSVTNTDFGWNAKLFRVMKVNEASLPDGSLGAKLEMNEYNSQVYDDKDITQFTPVPNSGLPSVSYFSALSAPTTTGFPTASFPHFDVTVYIPATGRVTYATLFYTTVAVPSPSDWKQLSSASSSNSTPVTNNTYYTFANQVLGAGTYYFAYVVGNDIGRSVLSPASSSFVWNPVAATGPTGPTGSGPTGPTGSLGPTGDAGPKYASAYLYQWSTVLPGDPSGTSTYTWADGSSSSYTGGNGWSVTAPSNPGTPLIRLWVATKQVTAAGTATTTSVSWASGFSINDGSQNGANGVQNASPTVYQWAVTIPTISGTSTYTWASGTFTPNPSGWSNSITTSPSPGYTLWAATVRLTDSATTTTSTINWTTASILAAGYAGTTGPTGSGTTGASARICYAKSTSFSLSSTPTTYTTSGSSSFPPYNTWGGAETWQATPPTLSTNEALFQSDGIYNPSTGNTIWNVPYLSNLKVGNLAAISVNTGALTVQDSITVSSAGYIRGGQTGYNTGTGFFLGYSGSAYKFSIGNPSTSALTWDGSLLNVQGTGKFFNPSSPYSYVELGIDGNGSSLRLYRTASTLLPPAYMIDTAPSGASPTLWISHTNGDCIYATTDSGYAISAYGGTSNSISTPVAYFQGSRQQAQLEVRGNQQAGSTSAHAGRFKIMAGSTIRSSAICGVDALNPVGGYYAFYAETGTYGPFTGSHDCLVEKTEVIEEGDIVVDVALIYKKDINNTLFSVTKSTQPNQFGIGVMIGTSELAASDPPAVFLDMVNTVITETVNDPEGNFLYNVYEPTVIPEFYDIVDTYNYGIMNAVGEGQVNVCGENGDIAVGDLIVTSSMPGKGMKQADNIFRSYTVAKARQAVTFSSPTDVQMIACIYVSG